jgi:hypothetical protein
MGMTDEKINQVLDRYEARLLLTLWNSQNTKALSHAKEMIPKVRVFLQEKRREKAFRWLGFLQGVFYSFGIYTIEEMAEHNRPTKAEIKFENPDHAFLDVPCCKLCKEYQEAPDQVPA